MSDGQRDSDVPFDIPEDDEEVISSLGEDSSEPVITSSIEFPEGASWTTTSGGGASGSGPHASPSSAAGVGPIAELGFQGPGVKKVARVDSRVFQIGRVNGDQVIDDRFLSPFHCQLRRESGTYLLEDLGSLNGVYLRIADELMLEDFDEFICGTQRMVFRTSWDAPEGTSGPHVTNVPSLGAAMPTDAARVIFYLAGGLVGGVYPIGDSLAIGRDSSDITVPNDPDLSRAHAEIVKSDDGYLIRDLQSTFGTFVRIHDPVELLDGDCFVIGRTRVSVRYP